MIVYLDEKKPVEIIDLESYYDEAKIIDKATGDVLWVAVSRLTLRKPDTAIGTAHEAPDAEAAAQVTLNG